MSIEGISSDQNVVSENKKAFVLNVRPRSETGSAKTRGVRRQGLIPAVAYEIGKEAVAFVLDKKQFYQLAAKALTSQVFTLQGEVKDLDGRKALVKEVQRDGIKGDVLHVDFLLLEEKRPAVVIVPVVVQGEAPGVKLDGGVLAVSCREVTLLAPPESIPSEIVIDVSHMRMSDRVRTRDIALPAGVVLKSSPDQTVAIVLSSRASKEEEAAAAAASATGAPAAAAAAKKAPEKK